MTTKSCFQCNCNHAEHYSIYYTHVQSLFNLQRLQNKYSPTCAKGHLRVGVSCPLGPILIHTMKIREEVSDTQSKQSSLL